MTEPTDAINVLAEDIPSPGEKFYPSFEPTPELETEAREYVAMYPEGRELSAVLPIIHMVQEKFGFICARSIPWIAEMCKSTPIHVAGVVSFYPGIRRKCPGKWHIRVCHTIACAMSGGEDLLKFICGKIGVKPEEMTEAEPMAVSADGLWSIEAVECLAHCGFGPNVMVNDTLYSRVTPEKMDEILEEYRRRD